MLIMGNPSVPDDVQHQQTNSEAYVQQRSLGNGILYIAESQVVWKAESGQGFSLEYPTISLHAVSRDTSSFPHECLYLMIDGDIGDQGNDSDSGQEEEEQVSEIRFVPQDKGTLDKMYQVMCECQALHPDEADSLSEEDGDEFYQDEAGIDHLTTNGQARLEHLENIFAAGDTGAGDIMQDGGEPQIGGLSLNDDHQQGNDPMDADENGQGQFDDAD